MEPPREIRPVVQEDVIVHRIVSAISEATNVATTELSTPLNDVVDTDGLVQLLSSGDETVRVTFPYQQYVVEAHGDGVVEVTDSRGGE